MWELYIMLQYARNAVSDNPTTPPPPPPKRLVLRSLDRIVINGYYLFSKLNRFGVCHLCELKVNMQIKPRKTFTVSKQFVRFSSNLEFALSKRKL